MLPCQCNQGLFARGLSFGSSGVFITDHTVPGAIAVVTVTGGRIAGFGLFLAVHPLPPLTDLIISSNGNFLLDKSISVFAHWWSHRLEKSKSFPQKRNNKQLP